MATITGLTADRMQEIVNSTIVDADVISDHLILTKEDGSTIDAGNVRGPAGTPGSGGGSAGVSILAGIQVLDVGLLNQIRAGRQLALTDFTDLGLSAPVGLWNLSDLSDASGNARVLSNKGAVPFDIGINGSANTAAKFSGSGAQALYISDVGGADPFRIRYGSFGFWFRTAKRNVAQMILSKMSSAIGNYAYNLKLDATNKLNAFFSIDGTDNVPYNSITGATDLADNRWHFVVVTMDGTLLTLYVDGKSDVNPVPISTSIFTGSGPFNIGAAAGDGSTAAGSPFFGRVDEAFVTGDILTAKQVRNLYCASVANTLAATPKSSSVVVRRRRRGTPLSVGDFPTSPLRLHNFQAGALADEGSQNVPFVNNNAALPVPGASGLMSNAFGFRGTLNQSLSASDAGLPAGLSARSFGCWFKTTDSADFGGVMGWGTFNTGDSRITVWQGTGVLRSSNAGDSIDSPLVTDGLWHFAVVVEDPASADGVKRKLYLDGKMVASSVTLNAITLGGTSAYRIGQSPNASLSFTGQIDDPFVCDYAMTFEQIATLYAKGSQALKGQPKNPEINIESLDVARVLVSFDDLESSALVDLQVA